MQCSRLLHPPNCIATLASVLPIYILSNKSGGGFKLQNLIVCDAMFKTSSSTKFIATLASVFPIYILSNKSGGGLSLNLIVCDAMFKTFTTKFICYLGFCSPDLYPIKQIWWRFQAATPNQL
ncbi:hypothetical protein TNIN_489961 [Trichonephila inaurata madagascariensis]|uniref:Uncharacterized protein n=1 Tax=Trichonephila inaurata madagascariensis TaxID=2747483 RepID=A0A8X6WZ13_9ARAC|nr:hypothetical protein TNIN_489961 [Trichonephila inaurata madagascariensis]